MLKKLYVKLTAVFLLAAFVIVGITGALILHFFVKGYENAFVSEISAVLDDGLSKDIQSILASQDPDPIKCSNLESAVVQRAGKLHLDDHRAFYILRLEDASIITPTVLQGETIQPTPNLQAAMKKAKADEIVFGEPYMDFACFIKSGTLEEGYIAYIRDDKTEYRTMAFGILKNIAVALLAAIFIAMLTALCTARYITRPIKRLTDRANNFTSGSYHAVIENIPGGEIGDLEKSFNHMGLVMSDSLAQMRAEKHKIEVILEHINNGIIAYNTNQEVLHINPAAKEMLRLRDGQDLRFDQLFMAYGVEICMAEFLYLQKFKTEVRDIKVGNGHIRAYFVPFKMDFERTAGVVCVFEDFTEQFNLEEARRKFVAEVSHELRTPLTTIKAYTETIRNSCWDNKEMASALLQTVENETDKMTALVQNLLTLSRFDVNKFELNKEPMDVDRMLRDLAEMYHIQAENKGLTLTYNRTTDLPQIYADKDQVERAVKNIITNAIKYTDKGGKINVYSGSLYNEVYIKVEDNGQGIKKENLDHVFERFYRVNEDRARKTGGTGLGLSIAKEIIENHGGSIKIESRFHSYTKVTIRLPMANLN